MMIRVFIADDHAIVRDGLRFILSAQPDIEVVGEAANGREAVRQVEQLCPDVVLMDISMPELNGIEAAQQIRERCPATQVVMLSVHSTGEHVFRALQAGAKGYLLKESASAEVIDAVREVHAGHRHLSAKIVDFLAERYVHPEQFAGAESPLAQLSPREREVLQLIAEGKSSAEIARVLALSPATVDTYRSRLMRKLGLTDLVGLIKFAIQHGLTPLE